MMDIDAYLARIAYHGPRSPSAETLRALHVAHLLAVPFENLSIHWHEPIVLDDDALFYKIVRRRRGGFCYELNGLFGALLRALGFDVAMLSARVIRDDTGEFGPEFDHMTLLVTLEERWLADVGFGDSFREPLLMDSRAEQVQDGGSYRIDGAGEHMVVLRRADDVWQPQYRFSLQAHELAAFRAMCHHHQTSPQSSFTQKSVCTRATPDGRITLSGNRLITTARGERRERELTAPECALVLRDVFGVARPEHEAPATFT